jgi:archaellum component FlaC
MATREVAKKGLAAAADKILREAMPSLQVILDTIQRDLRDLKTDVGQQIFKLDAQIVNLRDEIKSGLERVSDTMNDLQGRVIRVDGKLDGFMEANRQHTVNVMSLVERIARLEQQFEQNGKRKLKTEES